MHEDDYCMCEILPVESYSFCMQQCSDIADFAKEHTAENGVGYTDVYVGQSPKSMIQDLNINKDLLYNTFRKSITPYDKIDNDVFIDYDLGKTKGAYAFGETNHAVVFFSFHLATNIVEKVWLLLNPTNDDDIQVANIVFECLRGIGEFIYVDWNMGQVLFLNDLKSIQKYIQQL